MALRVLLADESSTIKKVFQLALQDFAVEVKPVNVGLDVAAVAESFEPDIIFADVLLQKKNGYDVSAEIKQNQQLSKTPVVLMWSGFMDLDEDKMEASGADGSLEKPFDVKSLRALVQSLVPRTKEQKLSSYLSFPKLPEFAESQSKKSPEAPKPEIKDESHANPAAEQWSMDSFSPPDLPATADDFQAVDLGAEGGDFSASEPPFISNENDNSDRSLIQDEDDAEGDSIWEQKNLGKYQLDDESLMSEDEEPDVNYMVPDESMDADTIMGRTNPPEPPIEANEELPDSTPGVMEEDLEIELDNRASDGAPSGMYAEAPPLPTEANDADDSYIPPGERRGKTVILNFSFDGDGGEESDGTRSNFVDPNSALKKLTAELDEAAISKVIEDQAQKMIEDAIWKIVPELATQIIERELKKLLDDVDIDTRG